MTEKPSTREDETSIVQQSADRTHETLEEHRERLKAEIDELLERMMREDEDGTRPLFWGWSLELDEEGTPTVSTHGNLRERFEQWAEDVEESFVDWHIEPESDTVTLRAELPGVEGEDVVVNVDDRKVEIEAYGENVHHEASCTLPVELVPDSAQATFEDGELTIQIRQEPRVAKKPVDVPVETARSASQEEA